MEEKKKLDQLRKEKEEERQLQELQRLQEEQTGRKRSEKLEWMYATPATGSSQNKNDLEDYLLGKKRVDKILVGDENEKVHCSYFTGLLRGILTCLHCQIGAAHKNFIAVQNANTARDVAAKIREDPLLAIKQQEQAAYQALMTNPLRLKEMKKRAGIESGDKKDKKDKKERKKEKKSKKDKYREEEDSHARGGDRPRRYSRSPSLDRHRRTSRDSRSPPRRYPVDDYGRGRSRSAEPRRRSRSRSVEGYRNDSYRGPPREVTRRSRSPRREYDRDRDTRWPASDETSSEERRRSRTRSPARRRYSDVPPRKRERSSTPPAYNKRSRMSPPSPRRPAGPPASSARPSNGSTKGYSTAEEDRAARLAAMSSNASSLTVERKERLTELLAREKAEMELEQKVRAKTGGMGSFLSAEQKKVFGGEGGLEDRIRRGRGGMLVDAE